MNLTSSTNDTTKLELTPENESQAANAVANIVSLMSYTKDRLNQANLTGGDADVILANLSYYFKDLDTALGNRQILSKKLDETRALLRQANNELYELKSENGRNTSARQVIDGLKFLEDLFDTWYSLCGFHYGSVSYSRYGLLVEFSSDVEKAETKDELIQGLTFGRKDLAKRYAFTVPYLFHKDCSEYDLFDDVYHANLLDTDRNRNLLKELFTKFFPEANIHGFESYQDGDQYFLRTKVFVPFEDLDAWRKSLD